MPEPISRFSLNKIVYNVTREFIGNNCKYLNANVITFFCNVLSIIILLVAFKKPCNFTIIFTLCFLRAVLDILDGAVARKCNTESKFGSLFDKTGDFLYEWSVYIMCLYAIYKNKAYNKMYFYPYFISALIFVFMGIMESINRTPGVWQDNNIVIKPVVHSIFIYLSSLC